MSGFAGKIVRINLSDATVSYIDTAKYEQWGGGHGMGSALFFDIAIREKGLKLEDMDHNSPTDGGFHPDNVITITTSPLNASGVPSATGRTEIQGIGVQSYPVGWFTRTNVGGRFGSMLKFAGYDAIVVEGQSPTPVWVDIRDESIHIRQCSELNLWGKDTIETQERIWDFVTDNAYNTWSTPEGVTSRTTQRPAVLAIGPAGENKNRMACILHDAGQAAGQGGFGGIWGAKNLKAISVIGTGSIPIKHPSYLLALRVFQKNNFQCDIDTATAADARATPLRHNTPPSPSEMYGIGNANENSTSLIDALSLNRNEDKRPQSCMGCYAACRARYASGKANEAKCATTAYYPGNTKPIRIEATDLLNRYGLNAFDMLRGVPYLKVLYDRGVLGGPGRAIETDLNFADFGSLEFIQDLLKTITYRDTPFGDTLADGFMRAILKWDRLDDLGTHIQLPYWGIPDHGYDVRAELEWGYGTILSDRDINEHCMNSIHHHIEAFELNPLMQGFVPAEETVAIFAEKLIPHADEYPDMESKMKMLDYSTENMYSAHVARLVSWHRHYSRYYKQSLLFCDWRWPDIINTKRPDKKGSTGMAEPKFIEAVTGQKLSFADGMRIGQKIWNLDNAIWTLQGRHRDMVHFADYVYTQDAKRYLWPTYDPNEPTANKWQYRNVGNRHIDRNEFENFKTRYYAIEGWDPSTGWPTQATLESLGMDDVAETLIHYGKL